MYASPEKPAGATRSTFPSTVRFRRKDSVHHFFDEIFEFETDRRPTFADPDKAARRLLEHARAFEPIQDGRIYIEKLNGPFLFIDKATPAEYTAGLELAISRGWLKLHESGTFVKLTQSGAPVFQN
jgi:hypothetical protein